MALAGGATALAACDTVATVRDAARGPFVAVTPTPDVHRVRVAFPRMEYYNLLRTRVLAAAKKIPADRGLQIDMVPIGMAVGTPEEQVADLPPPMPVVGTTYARRAPTYDVDLIVADPFTLPALATAGVLYDLNTLLETQRWYDPADFLTDSLRSGYVNGKLQALPLEVAVEVLWRRDPHFAAADVEVPGHGWTWDQFLDATKALRERGPHPRGQNWGVAVNAATPSLWSLAWQQGATVVSPDGGRVDLTEGGTQRAATFLADLVQASKVAPPPTQDLPGEDAHPIPRGFLIEWRRGRRGIPTGAALGGDFVGGPFTSRPERDASVTALPVTGDPRVLAMPLIMLAIPRNTPDLRRSLRALQTLFEAASGTMLSPRRQTLDLLRGVELALKPDEGEVLLASLRRAAYLPGGFPLLALPALHTGFILPVLSGTVSPLRAAQDARLGIETAIRAARTA